MTSTFPITEQLHRVLISKLSKKSIQNDERVEVVSAVESLRCDVCSRTGLTRLQRFPEISTHNNAASMPLLSSKTIRRANHSSE